MIRWRKVRTVAGFEFVSTVKRKGYLIATFGMPLFVILYGGAISGIGIFLGEKESQVQVYGVVDRAGILALERDVERPRLPEEVRAALDRLGTPRTPAGGVAWWSNFVFRPFSGEEPARAALSEGEIKAFFVIHDDYLESAAVDAWSREGVDFQGSESKHALRNLLVDRMLAGKVSDELAARVRAPIDAAASRDWTLTRDGRVEERQIFAVLARLFLPIGFTVLLFISLMMSASYLMQATAAEKENKVVEILLSSANPDEILAGKLLGLGGAGLLQVLIWFGMVIFGVAVSVAAMQAAGVPVPWLGLAGSLPFFLGGYLFFGSLMLGSGSLGSNLKESQQLSMIWIFLAVVPMIFLQILITEPNGTFGRVLIWIPFTAPVTAVLRMTLEPEGVAWWEIAGSLVVLIGSTWFALRLGARLFRVGMVLTGTRPRLREILRQARLAS